jgi:hypothetical protein
VFSGMVGGEVDSGVCCCRLACLLVKEITVH